MALTISKKTVAQLTKALGAEDSDPKVVLADFLKGLTDEPVETREEPVDDGAGGDPTGDVMRALHKAITTIRKAKGVDQDTEIQDAFQKAYDEMGQIVEDSVSAAFLAAQGEIGKRGKSAAEDDPEDEDPEDPEDPEDDEDMEKFLKRLPAKAQGLVGAVLKRNEKLEKRVVELETGVKKSRFAKRAAEIGEPAAFADTLLQLDRVDPKLADSVAKMLEGKNAVIRKSGLFQEQGDGGDRTASASDTLSAKASEIVQKSNGKTPFAKAFLEACQANPDLYNEHRAAQRAVR